MNNGFQQLNPNEVISISSSIEVLFLPYTFKVSELTNELTTAVEAHFRGNNRELLEEGTDVEVLRLDAKSWRRGKVKFIPVFCPSEPEVVEISETNNLRSSYLESSLDDLRQVSIKMFNKTNVETGD